jgi:lon-related putative ATP-dependent protease
VPDTSPLSPLVKSQLRRSCDPAQFGFDTTDELPDLDGAVGQSRALTALEFAMRMGGNGYNLYVLGRSGSHKHDIVEAFLESESSQRPIPDDWCYINNFDDPSKPLAVRLPPGHGVALRDDMMRLVNELRETIPATFESEHYRNRVAEIGQEFEDRHKAALEQLRDAARAENMSLVQTPHGFAIAPTRDGKLLDDAEFEKLPEDEKKKTLEAIDRVTEQIRKHMQEIPSWQKAHRERIKALNRETTDLAVGRLIDQLDTKYREFPQLLTYLRNVREDILANPTDFHEQREDVFAPMQAAIDARFNRFKVNVLVDHSERGKAPVVYENKPSLQNLLGTVEHLQQFGALITDFTMIKAGAFHRANGGFLILDADRLLTEPYAWSALKRTLFSREIKIETLGQLLNLVSTVSPEPEPIPLDLKVVLIGERRLYYLLCELDSDFDELFKVAADFEDRLDRNNENTTAYARLIASIARKENLLPVSKEAVARTIEHSSRLAADSEKLTTRVRDVSDLLRESNFWAVKEAASAIGAAHVQSAIDAQIHRLDRVRAEIQEGIQRNTILIDTSGERTGQVNGLSVLKAGSFMFGQPSRITATVRIGDGKIIDIERETELGGPLHSKGVLIVASYISSRFGGNLPLSFSASLVFEQSYGGVEGDSASVAETCALLSALSGLPIRQSMAVTGSVNQHGCVQVIGGVNEKIEGFFDICAARGLSGEQAVIIPRDNIKHLMLRQDVVDAVGAGKFKIFAISHIDEAIELLTGRAAGQEDANGQFAADTVNGLVDKRLGELAEARRAFAAEKKREEDLK